MTSTAASRADALDLPNLAGVLLDRLRGERPRVHVITNAAAPSFTANLLLAAGGLPSLTTAPDEAPDFTTRSDALLVNLGTLDAERRAAIPRCIAAARAQHKRWVLDPVFVDLSPPRLQFARFCVAGSPCVVRCNRDEFAALAGTETTEDAARTFAREHGGVVALTGATDLVTDGTHAMRIANGHPLMTRVTAMGCAGAALIGAFAALHESALEAAAAGLLVTGVAGELAAGEAAGPGSFPAAFLDALFGLDTATLSARARVA